MGAPQRVLLPNGMMPALEAAQDTAFLAKREAHVVLTGASPVPSLGLLATLRNKLSRRTGERK